MSTVSSQGSSRTGRTSLPSQMRRVVVLVNRTTSTLESGDVHKLRVALRRCRSFASILEEVDPDPAWPRLRHLCRKLFRVLGTLRDTQVAAHWIHELTSSGDRTPSSLRDELDRRAHSSRDRVRRALGHFDRREWKDLTRTLEHRVPAVVPNRAAAQCLVLERYETVSRLHESAVSDSAPAAWHALRVAVKQLRYAVETILPARLTAWDKGLRKAQNLLGEIHDLDLLDAFLAERRAGEHEEVNSLRRAVTMARRGRVEEYRQRTTGTASLLKTWRRGLPSGARVASVVAARFKATAHAGDAHPRRTARVTRLVSRLFSALPTPADKQHAARTRAIVDAAGQLNGVRAALRGSPPNKAAAAFLRKLPVPPGWTPEDWEMVSLVVRYQRGAEPEQRHRRFARLSRTNQDVVRRLAGILRLARTSERDGVKDCRVVKAHLLRTLRLAKAQFQPELREV